MIASLRSMLIAASLLASIAPLYAQSAACANPASVPFPLSNPGFEGAFGAATGCSNVSGAVASGWTDNTCWDPALPTIRYARDPIRPHAGESSQRISLKAGSRMQFGQFLSTPLERGRRYSISFWMRGEVSSFVAVELREQGPPYRTFSSKLVRLKPRWTEYVFDVHADAVDAVLLFIATKPVTFSVDDVAFCSVASPNPLPPSTPIPRSNFGMHFNQLDTPWPAVGDAIGMTRIWDAGPNLDGSSNGSQWVDINSTEGAYDWSGLDARVNAATTRGVDVIYTLGGRTPRWASARPDEPSPYGEGQAAEPRNMQIWRDWVRTVATRYRNQIKYWEIWNEPDLTSFFSGTPDKLVSLGRVAYQEIKRVDPNLIVVSPGFSGFPGTAWLDYYLSRGGGRFADIIAYHSYVDRPEEVFEWRTATILATLERHGASGKPLWNTEQGWLDVGASPVIPFPPEKSKGYVARSHLLSWATGFKNFSYYTWDNEWSQILFTGSDRATLTPAGKAYREIAAWMRGNVMESLTVDGDGNYVATLRYPDTRRARAIWNPSRTFAFPIPSSWGATVVRDLEGGSVLLGGATTVNVGEAPLLVE